MSKLYIMTLFRSIGYDLHAQMLLLFKPSKRKPNSDVITILYWLQAPAAKGFQKYP